MRFFKCITAFLALLSITAPQIAEAAFTACAVPGRDGDATISTSGGIVNTYFPGTANVAVGATSITIGTADSRGATTAIAVGDLLLVVQVQGATITSTNSSAYGAGGTTGRGQTALALAGNYEYVRATSAVSTGGGTLTISSGLAQAYQTGAPSTTVGAGSTGRKRFEIIRVPQYRNLTLSGGMTAPVWNGATGGIVALDVAATLTLSGTAVDVSGKGFRGGGGIKQTTGTAYAVTGTADYATNASTNVANGQKGEGLAGTPYYVFDGSAVTTLTADQMPGNLNASRGAPSNGGGGATDGNPTANDQNSGGGGGANAGQGGQGGYAWCSNYATANGCPQTGGIGGGAQTGGGSADLFLGGGGGAGDTNDGTGTMTGGAASSGAPGGGAILIRTRTLAGSGTLAANGGTFTSGLANDGAGGGGAGGTIQVFATTYTGSVTGSAVGGAGMSNTGAGSSHGPGGGGGGGFVISNVAIGTSAGGGLAGTTATGAAYGTAYGATAGSTGSTNTALTATSIPGSLYSGADCSPIVTKAFNLANIPVGGTSKLTVTVANPNPTLSLTNAAVSDPLPTNVTVGSTPAGATTCSAGTVAATAGGSTAAITAATVAAAASCNYSVNVTSSTAGSYLNTIPAGALTGTIGGGTVTNMDPGTATLQVTPGLAISKAETTYSDPVNGTTNPKSIPGAYIQYALTVTNPSTLPITADSVVLSDNIPTNTQLIVSSVYTTAGATGARGPFQYIDGLKGDGTTGTSSSLTFTFNSLSDTTDSPSFSSDGTTFTYSPTVNANNTDASVKTVQFKMFGTMAASSVFTIRFLVRIN